MDIQYQQAKKSPELTGLKRVIKSLYILLDFGEAFGVASKFFGKVLALLKASKDFKDFKSVAHFVTLS